ncbi:hypothetical protein OLX02_10290 [Novosphingobium sp. KCTC 2891]|uniref:hypothetical protein n=1 Tax=Novosphingobium sp. KCTC 2891 TaxID=2989730 RepID=UPI002221E20C|nr:hypothetical protein [Novosphingobium sp. KCTC 2891]MCW1383211.1 hypothetical protein [Novosphingobium sp. KCTC 2891]
MTGSGIIGIRADLAGLERRLREKAQALGARRADAVRLGPSPRKWRAAALLWPLFGKD